MKYFLSLTIAALLVSTAIAQRTELSFRLNSGLASFSGESVKETSLMLYDLRDENGNLSEQFGNLLGPSFGVSLNLSRVLNNKIKFGADLGFDLLKSKIEINQVKTHSAQPGQQNEQLEADGYGYLNLGNLNFFPSIGYRLLFEDFFLDIDAGADLGYNLLTKEKGSADTESRSFETKLDRETISMDIRPRVQMGITFRTFGGYVGYSKGLTNYKQGSEKAFLDVIRIGVYYTIKLKGKDYLKFRRR